MPPEPKPHFLLPQSGNASGSGGFSTKGQKAKRPKGQKAKRPKGQKVKISRGRRVNLFEAKNLAINEGKAFRHKNRKSTYVTFDKAFGGFLYHWMCDSGRWHKTPWYPQFEMVGFGYEEVPQLERVNG